MVMFTSPIFCASTKLSHHQGRERQNEDGMFAVWPPEKMLRRHPKFARAEATVVLARNRCDGFWRKNFVPEVSVVLM